ncbi:MAG: hypothetical protein V7765_19340 [Oleispira sp.]
MVLKVLIVEDNEYKRDKIALCIENEFVGVEIFEAKSFTSGWKAILNLEFDLVCLDMSLPTVDKTSMDSGGELRTFGGKELAKKAIRRKLQLNIVVLTQYKNFSHNSINYTFEKIKEEFICDVGESCLGFLHYSNTSSQWKSELIQIIKELT